MFHFLSPATSFLHSVSFRNPTNTELIVSHGLSKKSTVFVSFLSSDGKLSVNILLEEGYPWSVELVLYADSNNLYAVSTSVGKIFLFDKNN